jgi:hypothetical protein
MQPEPTSRLGQSVFEALGLLPNTPVPEGTEVEGTEEQSPPLPLLPRKAPSIDWAWKPVTVIPDSQPEEEESVRI